MRLFEEEGGEEEVRELLPSSEDDPVLFVRLNPELANALRLSDGSDLSMTFDSGLERATMHVGESSFTAKTAPNASVVECYKGAPGDALLRYGAEVGRYLFTSALSDRDRSEMQQRTQRAREQAGERHTLQIAGPPLQNKRRRTTVKSPMTRPTATTRRSPPQQQQDQQMTHPFDTGRIAPAARGHQLRMAAKEALPALLPNVVEKPLSVGSKYILVRATCASELPSSHLEVMGAVEAVRTVGAFAFPVKEHGAACWARPGPTRETCCLAASQQDDDDDDGDYYDTLWLGFESCAVAGAALAKAALQKDPNAKWRLTSCPSEVASHMAEFGVELYRSRVVVVPKEAATKKKKKKKSVIARSRAEERRCRGFGDTTDALGEAGRQHMMASLASFLPLSSTQLKLILTSLRPAPSSDRIGESEADSSSAVAIFGWWRRALDAAERGLLSLCLEKQSTADAVTKKGGITTIRDFDQLDPWSPTVAARRFLARLASALRLELQILRAAILVAVPLERRAEVSLHLEPLDTHIMPCFALGPDLTKDDQCSYDDFLEEAGDNNEPSFSSGPEGGEHLEPSPD